MPSCNDCGIHRCNIFNNKRNPVALCKKYTPFVYPKVQLRFLVSNITLGNPSPEVLGYFRRWM